MSRKLLLIYAAISVFAVLIYLVQGGGSLDPARIALAALFILAAGPIVKMYWEERDKARQRRRLKDQKAKEIEE